MESPVRICLGAALVVNLLVLSTRVSGDTLLQTTPESVREDRITKLNRLNTTWSKTKPKTPDISVNELSPKDSISEEDTDKNAKYKDRGRVKYFTQLKSTTESSLRRVRSSTEVDKLMIVTPTSEVKKPVEIIDSMKIYKKTKMPMSISSTTPMAIKTEVQSVEEFDDEEEEEENESFEKFTSSKFHDSFFTIPSFGDDHDSFSNKVKQDYSSPSYGFSSFFPKETSYSFDDKDDNLKSESFFSFDSDLTTPKNDFFDKKYQQISGSIIKKLESIKIKEPKTNVSDIHKIVKENVGLENLSNNKPTNKSTVFITNTKEIRLHDNEGAGTSQRQLSDVQGTSIYYEMSVLSTETYINHTSDDDCDGDTLPSGPTASTSVDEELSSLKFTQPSLTQTPSKDTLIEQSTMASTSTEQSVKTHISTKRPILVSTSPKRPVLVPTTKKAVVEELSTKPTNYVQISTETTLPDLKVENITTASTNFVPISSVIPFYHTVIPVSTQNIISSPERVTKVYLNSYSRSKNYSKRLNFTGVKDSPNSVTAKPEISTLRPLTRKFYYTTPRTRPIWMLPKRNVTKIDYVRPTSRTIYSEHFNIKDKLTTTHKPKQNNKSVLTTVSSDIDPVLQSDISGIKKVVHFQTITDNSIPTLWKRGSTKFKTSTATSAEVSDIDEMELPPTSIAWSLASMLPSQPSSFNATLTTKRIHENELTNDGENTAEKDIATGSSTTTARTISENIISKNITEVEQNKLTWQPINTPTSPGPAEIEPTSEGKSEKLAAESNISVKSSVEPVKTETLNKSKVFSPAWIPTAIEINSTTNAEAIPPVGTTKSTGFESITKLPSDITTPQDDNTASSKDQDANEEKIKTTTDYEITTIRFSYVPVESGEVTEYDDTESATQSTWQPVMPTRTRITTVKDSPITTYRPKYMTTTDVVDEVTTIVDTTSAVIEVSSQILENSTEKEPTTTETIDHTIAIEPTAVTTITETTNQPSTLEITTQTTTEQTTQPTTVEVTFTPITTTSTTTTTTTTTPASTTTLATTTEEDTTTIVVEVVTEINTEREKIITTDIPTTEAEMTSEITTDCSSEENSNSNEIIIEEKTTVALTTEVQTTEKQNVPTTESVIFENVNQGVPETTTQRIEIPETTTQEVETTTQIKPELTPEVPEVTSQKVTISVVTTVSKADTTPTSKILSTTTEESDMDFTSKTVNEWEDPGNYGEMTTEASSRTSQPEEASTGAAVAIAVSTIGVIALVLLIGLLLVVRRRGRRGIYAQRCTPVSLDAYSLDSVSIGHRKGNHRLRASKRSYGNPAYDDEVTSHPMQYPALANFALDIESMSAEFAEIPSVTVRPEEVPPGCEDKNRYSNVLPLPETRVPLIRLGNDPATEYINANYITGPGNIRNYYIACQAPLSNTVVDFWRMVWEQNSRLIVMLTEYMENGVEKCYEFLPPSEISDNKRIFGDFKIILKKREQRDKYAISSVQLINLSTRTWREITHLWYFWPAKGVPDDYDSILDFLSEMRNYMKVSQTAKEFDEEGVEVIYGDQNRSSFNNLSKLRSDDNSSGNGVNVYSPSKAEEMMRRGPANNGTLGRMKAASEIEGVRPCVVTCASGAGRSAVLIALDVCARALAAGCADVPRAVRHLRAQRPHSLSNRHHYTLLYKVLSEYGNKLIGGVDTI